MKRVKKRGLRKERQAVVDDVQKQVDTANKINPLANMMSFTQFERNGLSLSVECQRSTNLSTDTLGWAFELTKSNMQSLYETSDWGWKDREKKAELSDPSAWYLLARLVSSDKNDGEQPVAFVHFRYDLDDGVQVLYCYEIQLMETVRRKGLGKMFMKILEALAFQSRMKKVMLTVFNANSVAKKFFMENLKYAVDETSPSIVNVEATYEILSKRIG